MTTEGGDANISILKLLLPRLCLARVREQFGCRAMIVTGISTGANLHSLKAEG
jgi:hypothetical protein